MSNINLTKSTIATIKSALDGFFVSSLTSSAFFSMALEGYEGDEFKGNRIKKDLERLDEKISEWQEGNAVVVKLGNESFELMRTCHDRVKAILQSPSFKADLSSEHDDVKSGAAIIQNAIKPLQRSLATHVEKHRDGGMARAS